MKRRTYFGTVVWLAFVFSCQVQRIHATFDSPDYLVPASNSDPDITLNMTVSKSDGTEEEASIYLPENHVGELGIFLYTVGSTPSVTSMSAEETATNVDPDTYLSINDTTGAMMLIESFDYDTGMHTYVCTAKSDNSVKPFYIYVSDVNDNYPVWDDDIETSLTIPENKKGWVAQYEATDVDTMDQGKLYYSVNQYGYNYFYMNSSTGDLYVENPLDYETLTYLSIVVSCADTADHTIYESVQIFVKDEPDQPPEFTKYAPVSQLNEKTTGVLVFTVAAMDGDRGINNSIGFNITDGNDDGYFDIPDYTVGDVYVVKAIDADGDDGMLFSLVITAFEIPEPNSTADATSEVFVMDLDDNFPLFTSNNDTAESFTVNINERTLGIVTFDKVIEVVDIDTGTNGTVSVELADYDDSPTQYTAAFSVSPQKGLNDQVFYVYVEDSDLLDYENSLWQEFGFQIIFTEVGNTSHVATGDIYITLNDTNDHTPVFEDSYYLAFIPEDSLEGVFVINITATDEDIYPEYGTPSIRYSLKDDSDFTIDSVTGEVTVATNSPNFDYDVETRRYGICTVYAIDDYGQGNTASVTLNVTVTDVDDNPPTFDSYLMDAQVNESDPIGTIVTNEIYATDIDTEPYLMYYIDWSNTRAFFEGAEVYTSTYDFTQCFDIETVHNTTNHVNGIVTVGDVPPDREKMDRTLLTIVIYDNNTVENSATSTTTLTVSILDANDNAPTIDNITDTVEVYENSDIGTRIVQLFAEDLDLNPVFYWAIEEVNPEDNIDGLVGFKNADNTDDAILQVAGNIDYEEHQYLLYNVTVFDGIFTTPDIINITVIDINDNYPQFVDFDNTVSIYENSGDGTYVTTVFATDADSGPFKVIGYGLLNTYDRFTIDVNEGNVTVELIGDAVLDRETLDQYTIYATAEDNYGYTGTHNVNTTAIYIQLLDVNDNAPIFYIDTLTAAVYEDVAYNETVISVIVATDKDIGNNSVIDFHVVDITGVWSNNVEMVDPVVTDEEMLNFFDVRDAKYISEGEYQTSLFVSSSLINCYGYYNVSIEAIDRGTPPLSSISNYRIEVIDINNNYPQYVFPDYSGERFGVWKESAIGDVYDTTGTLLQFHATDADYGLNGNVTYILDDDDDDHVTKYFTVNRYTGIVSLIHELDEEAIALPIFSLTVTATDHGDTPNTNVTSMVIDVIVDENYPPEFLQDTDNLGIYENHIVTKEIYQAYDANDFINSTAQEVCYYLVGGDTDMFVLLNQTRYLQNTETFDRETVDHYDVVVFATDQCQNSNCDVDLCGYTLPVYSADVRNSSYLNVSVQVLDENDNPPSFNQSFQGGVAPEDEQGQKQIVQVHAFDPDLNDTTFYWIEEDSIYASDPSLSAVAKHEPFIFDDDTSGIIILNFAPTTSMKGHFTFVVNATDKANNTCIHTGNVTVYMITEDDRIEITFSNPYDTVYAEMSQITDLLSNIFGYTCAYDSVSPGTIEGAVTYNATAIVVHFIDDAAEEPVGASDIIRTWANYQTQIYEAFLTELGLELTYYAPLVTSNDSSSNDELWLEMLLLCILIILFVSNFVLAVMFCVCKKKDNRKIRALATPAVTSNENIKRVVLEPVPTSNRSREIANDPRFTMTRNFGKKAREELDNISQISEESVLDADPVFMERLGGSFRPNFVPPDPSSIYAKVQKLGTMSKASLNPMANTEPSYAPFGESSDSTYEYPYQDSSQQPDDNFTFGPSEPAASTKTEPEEAAYF